MLKRVHTNGKWKLTLEETGSDPSVDGDLSYDNDLFYGSLALAIDCQVVENDQDSQDTMRVPDSICIWASDLEEQFYYVIQGN